MLIYIGYWTLNIYIIIKYIYIVIILLMTELYTTNDQIHDHFTRQYIFKILIKDVTMFTQEALVI